MTMYKTLGSIVKNGIVVQEQRHVLMHPLEQESIKTFQDMATCEFETPLLQTPQEEMDTLLNNGADAVKQNRIDIQNKIDECKKQFEQLKEIHLKAHDIWCSHQNLCCANGQDPDTFEGDANLKLSMPQENV